jgi:hypothetical protein
MERSTHGSCTSVDLDDFGNEPGSSEWKEWKERSNFFTDMQWGMALAGIYLPCEDEKNPKTHESYFVEQFWIPFAEVCRSLCNGNNYQDQAKSIKYGTKRWLIHWAFTRVVLIVQIGVLIETLLRFSIFDDDFKTVSFSNFKPIASEERR